MPRSFVLLGCRPHSGGGLAVRDRALPQDASFICCCSSAVVPSGAATRAVDRSTTFSQLSLTISSLKRTTAMSTPPPQSTTSSVPTWSWSVALMMSLSAPPKCSSVPSSPSKQSSPAPPNRSSLPWSPN